VRTRRRSASLMRIAWPTVGALSERVVPREPSRRPGAGTRLRSSDSNGQSHRRRRAPRAAAHHPQKVRNDPAPLRDVDFLPPPIRGRKIGTSSTSFTRSSTFSRFDLTRYQNRRASA
jgi:hypothetical protein